MKISFQEMKNTIKEVFIKHGLDKETAELCAKTHTESSWDGVYSHGTNRVARFVSYLDKGWVDPKAKLTLEKEFGSIAVYNGNLGPGIPNAFAATDAAIALANTHGIGMVGLKNTTHWMRGGTYGLHAANKGCVLIAWTNTESCMPPWGGTEERLGNNPIVMAAPTKDSPILLDMAMSQYAYGKLQVTRLAGEKLPYPGGFDKEGNLTNDPGAIEESRRILPMGYWKGSSFAFMLDVLGAVLSDGIGATDIDKVGKGSCGGASQIFIAINPEKLTTQDHLYEVIEKAKEYIKTSPKDGTSSEISYPGEGRVKSHKTNTEDDIFVDDTVWQEILNLR